MPVQRDGAIKFLGTRDEALQPRLDAVLVPVAAKDAHAARLQHIFLHAVGKIAVALDDDGLFGVLAREVADIGRAVAEMNDHAVLQKERPYFLDIFQPSVRIGQDDTAQHNFSNAASALPRCETAFFSASVASAKDFLRSAL